MHTAKFEDLDLSVEIQKAVKDMGFEEATPIQTQSIPVIMQGRDVLGQAQTGTGKTASFAIPIIENIEPDSKKIQAVVLCPTRELAIQVAEEFSELLKYKKNIKVIPVYGGQSIDRQFKALKSGVQIIIATPGRLLDHIERGTINLSDVIYIVLDEADEMLDMGFRDDIESIIKSSAKERQTVFFSATIPPAIVQLSKKYLNDPVHIKVIHKELTVPKVKQYYLDIKSVGKLEVLTRLVDIYDPELTLVFCNTKRMVDDLVSHLQARGYPAEGLHGDMKQMMRDRVMSKFRNRTLDILVATDVAARGIDVDEIDAVVNYDMPQDEEYYVHRIGRTARAGREGRAFTFVKGKDFRKLKDIEKYTKTPINKLNVPTEKDVEEVRTKVLQDEISNIIKTDKKLNLHDIVIQKLLSEEHSLEDIASALLKLVIGKTAETEAPVIPERSYSGYDDDDRQSRKKSYGRDRKRDEGRGRRDDKRGDKRGDRKSDRKSDRSGSDRNSTGSKRIFINIGKSAGIKPKDILGAIAGETGIPGTAVGEISIFDKYSFVNVDGKYSNKVVKVMNDNQIKGNKIFVEYASDKKYSR
ncbi:MAG TPA: DEAD/DEAH box helicase [Ignavibacteria bacterium]|nr:ATP-dependent RNA helicase [Bacteroidota bacterium]HRI85444.1 DEAD/DEAH box helicase [Ignavibacteria bacterium]HRJ99430.1 DEAD/DEAH box helicase [Ignavibacteria bacterium]